MSTSPERQCFSPPRLPPTSLARPWPSTAVLRRNRREQQGGTYEVARLYGPHTLVYRDEPDVSPQAGEVLVKVEAVGICGSDMHAYQPLDSRRRPQLVLGLKAAGALPLAGDRASEWRSTVWLSIPRVLTLLRGAGICHRRARSSQCRRDPALSRASCESQSGMSCRYPTITSRARRSLRAYCRVIACSPDWHGEASPAARSMSDCPWTLAPAGYSSGVLAAPRVYSYSGTPAFLRPSTNTSQWANFAKPIRIEFRVSGGPSRLLAAMNSCASSISPRCPQQLTS